MADYLYPVSIEAPRKYNFNGELTFRQNLAGQFNGTTSRLDIPLELFNQEEGAWEVKAKANWVSGDNPTLRIFNSFDSRGNDYSFRNVKGSTTYQWVFGSESGETKSIGFMPHSDASDGDTFRLSVTWKYDADTNTTRVTSYRNGHFEETVDLAGKIAFPDQRISIGYWMSGHAFEGTLDDFRLWNRELQHGEIQENHDKRIQGNEDGLVAYFTFDSGEATYDTVTKSHIGTAVDIEVVPGLFRGEVTTFQSDDAVMNPVVAHAISNLGGNDYGAVGGIDDVTHNIIITESIEPLATVSDVTVVSVLKPDSISDSAQVSSDHRIMFVIRDVTVGDLAEVSDITIGITFQVEGNDFLEMGGIEGVRSAVSGAGVEGYAPGSNFGDFSVKYSADIESIDDSVVPSPVVAQLVPVETSIEDEPVFGIPHVGTRTTNISPDIWGYDPDLFNKLYAMESHSYNTAEGEAVYGPEYTALSNAIVAWMGHDRTEEFRELIDGISSYLIMHKMYGISGQYITPAKAHSIYGMDGYSDRIKKEDDSYYSDYDGTTVTRLKSDTTAIQNTGISGDTARVQDILTKMETAVRDKVLEVSINGDEPVGEWTQEWLRGYMFDVMKYRGVAKFLNVRFPIK